MLKIDLTEYEDGEPVRLSHRELVTLHDSGLGVGVRPDPAEDGKYILKPGPTVGAAEFDSMSILIRPKIGIPQLLSIACYAMTKFKLRLERFNFDPDESLADVLALILTSLARRAFSQGLLHDYVTREESLYTVRGRILFDEQMRRRYSIPLPIEVRYEEFTDDILANRLVKAAAARLGAMRLRQPLSRQGLSWTAAVLDSVSYVSFPSVDVPEVTFNRLNEHYRGVVELSRLILRHTTFEANRGEFRAFGFRMNMNEVFQEFVTVALREELRLPVGAFGESWICSLDRDNEIGLRPDLVWREGSSYRFVGDAKYKDITGEEARSGDLYQLLAYVTALNVPGGMLVYAEGEADEVVHEVRHRGKRLEVATLDISGDLDKVLSRVGKLAERIRELASPGSTVEPYASGRSPSPETGGAQVSST